MRGPLFTSSSTGCDKSVGESRSVCEVLDAFGRPEKRPTLVFLGLPLLLLAFLPRSPLAGELEPDPESALEFFDGLFRSSWVLEPFLRPNSFEKKPMLTTLTLTIVVKECNVQGRMNKCWSTLGS